MKRYDTYKDSGVQWIGEIPSHWEICRLKNHSQIVLGKMLMSSPPKGQEHLYTLEKYLKSRNVGWLQLYVKEEEVEEMWFNSDEKKIYELKPNDIVMNEGGDVGKVGLWEAQTFKCYIQNSINKITPDSSTDPSYLSYYLFSVAKSNYFWSIVNPVSIAHLTKEKLSSTPMVLPPLAEQESIAAWLDVKGGEIDKVIATQQRRIELLQELRQGIITRAVTHGINPDATMKPSGIDWIGDIPAHWEIRKTSLIYNHIGSGTTPKSSNSDYYTENEDGYFWLQTGDLNDGEIVSTSKQVTKLAIDECNLKFFPKESVVIAMYGATIGKVGLLKISTATNQACCVLPHSSLAVSKFSFYLYQAAKAPMLVEAIGGGQPNISQDVIKKLRVPLPPLAEQQEIVNYIERETAKVDASIGKAERQIALLQELRQSVITEVVTGKRKVC